MTLHEIITDIKLAVLIFAAALIVEMFLIWTCETEYWRAFAETVRNL